MKWVVSVVNRQGEAKREAIDLSNVATKKSFHFAPGHRLTKEANRRCRSGAVVGDEKSGKIDEDADSQRQRPG